MLSESPEIRLAGSSDLPAALGLLLQQFAEHGIAVNVGALERALAAVLAVDRLGFLLLAARAGRLIGVAYASYIWSLEHAGRSLWLDELFVLPEERGRGVGGALLREVLRRAREAGCAAVDLEVERKLSRAENLYRRAGFTSHERARWVKRLDGDPSG